MHLQETTPEHVQEGSIPVRREEIVDRKHYRQPAATSLISAPGSVQDLPPPQQCKGALELILAQALCHKNSRGAYFGKSYFQGNPKFYTGNLPVSSGCHVHTCKMSYLYEKNFPKIHNTKLIFSWPLLNCCTLRNA